MRDEYGRREKIDGILGEKESEECNFLGKREGAFFSEAVLIEHHNRYGFTLL